MIVLMRSQKKSEIANNASSTMLDKADDHDISGLQTFTIRNLDNKRSIESDIEQYKLLSVREDPIDNRQQHLDVMCFPMLYPTGKFHPREVKISHSLSNLGCLIKTLASGKILSMYFTLTKRNARAFCWCVQSAKTVPQKPAYDCRYIVEQCTNQ